ncbi:MAG: ABC transporter permease [Bacteroidales bacterium]|jgi:putative ABC transport system permease protein|nr:ABC transporter permease [Bacteroidales bacterium]
MDILFEIFGAFNRNKMRTILTGFAVSWGIFMLIVLLGAGNGLINGVKSNFQDRAKNVVRIYPGWTTTAYGGYDKWREIKLNINDLELLEKEFSETIEVCIPTINKWGQTVSRGSEYSNLTIAGVKPKFSDVNAIRVKAGKGRNINQQDINERRKVIVIHPKTEQVLFPDVSAIGQYVNVGSIAFQVVGIYEAEAASEEHVAYIPYSTAAIIYNSLAPDNLSLFVKNLNTKEDNEKFTETLRHFFAKLKSFDPEDRSAIWINNRYEGYLQTQFIFNIIAIAVWIIGILTLISGIVGVSNIMLISVKERTKEFGIRKAIGAKPSTILKAIIIESILITAVFGYIGMFAGIGITELLNVVMEKMSAGVAASDGPGSGRMFLNPTVNISIAIGATLVLIVAGTLAGFFPAKKAVSIKPVEALATK